jgi:hypothetical protein
MRDERGETALRQPPGGGERGVLVLAGEKAFGRAADEAESHRALAQPRALRSPQ